MAFHLDSPWDQRQRWCRLERTRRTLYGTEYWRWVKTLVQFWAVCGSNKRWSNYRTIQGTPVLLFNDFARLSISFSFRRYSPLSLEIVCFKFLAQNFCRDRTPTFLWQKKTQTKHIASHVRFSQIFMPGSQTNKSGHSKRSDRPTAKILVTVIRAHDGRAEFRPNWNVYNISVNCEF